MKKIVPRRFWATKFTVKLCENRTQIFDSQRAARDTTGCAGLYFSKVVSAEGGRVARNASCIEDLCPIPTLMSFELPIFPLGVTLFPGMPLPLHIFEPRYRQMIGKCLEGDREFGVAGLAEGIEGMAGTRPVRVGTVAKILEVAPFADGRMNLQTIGTRRFEILSTREENETLVGVCRWLEEESEDPYETNLISVRARRVLSRYFDSLSVNTDLPLHLGELSVPDEPYALSMFIAAIISLPSDQKQQLLELTSTQHRLEIEEFLLERADLVQRAFSKHAARGFLQPPVDAAGEDLSPFVSLN